MGRHRHLDARQPTSIQPDGWIGGKILGKSLGGIHRRETRHWTARGLGQLLEQKVAVIDRGGYHVLESHDQIAGDVDVRIRPVLE